MKVRRMEQVLLYNEDATDKLDIEEIAEYLREKLGEVPVAVRGNPFTPHLGKSRDYATKLASLKIQEVSRRIAPEEERPLLGEIQYEERRILGKTTVFGVLYDGFHLQRVLAELMLKGENSFRSNYIFFTNRLFATWEENDKRYHARTSIYGFPAIISTTGLVEAPAKPREYYLLKQQYELLGKDLLELKEKFRGSFIDYEDERLTEVIKGYAMQAVFYLLTGNPFCEDKGCRLYNAHWQEEVIFAQLDGEYEFCERHATILDSLRKQMAESTEQ